MNNLQKKIEMLANLAIVVVAVVLIGVLVYRFAGISSATPKGIKVGEKIELADTNWTDSEQTMVLVLQKGCHFCQESMDFYKKVTETTKKQGKTKLIAVFPTSAEDSAVYLSEQGVKVDEVKQSTLGEINVRGTPTVLLVDKEGKVTNSWVGKLPNEKESEVLSKL